MRREKESVDKRIWRARRRILDLMEEVDRMASHAESYPEDDFEDMAEFESPTAEWLASVSMELARANWTLHDAEGDAIRMRLREQEREAQA